MLAPKTVAAIFFVWVVAALLGGLYEMSWLGSSEQSLMNKVLFYDIVSTEGTWGVTELVGSSTDFFEALWQMATFQFSFITGDYGLVRWIVFLPLTAYLVYGVVMTVISILRGTIGSS